MDISPSPWLYEARDDLRSAGEPLLGGQLSRSLSYEVRPGKKSLWMVLRSKRGTAIALRAAHSPAGRLRVLSVDKEAGPRLELMTPLGAMRLVLGIGRVLRCTTSLLPIENVQIPFW